MNTDSNNKPRPLLPPSEQTYQPPWTKSAATRRVQTRCPIPLAVILITNKLTFEPPTRLPELTQNVMRSSHGHSTPSLKISCKSVQPFSRNVADKETKKSPENNTRSPYRGRGNKQEVSNTSRTSKIVNRTASTL